MYCRGSTRGIRKNTSSGDVAAVVVVVAIVCCVVVVVFVPGMDIKNTRYTHKYIFRLS